MSGFEILLAIKEENRLQALADAEIERNPTDCPECDWPLSTNSRGNKACPMCGRLWE
jgi:hypothetical protein